MDGELRLVSRDADPTDALAKLEAEGTRRAGCYGRRFLWVLYFVAVDKESTSPVGATNLTGSNLHGHSEPVGYGAWMSLIIPTTPMLKTSTPIQKNTVHQPDCISTPASLTLIWIMQQFTHINFDNTISHITIE